MCGGLEDAEGETIVAFARGGGPVLGVGDGFQALCALGLLPGRVTALADDDRPADAHVRVEGRATPFTSAIPAGRVMSLNGAHDGRPSLRHRRARGARGAGASDLPVLRRGGRALLRPLGQSRGRPAQLRLSSVPLIAPRERSRLIAGVCGEAGNVVGVLAVAATIEGFGAQLLGSLRMHLRGKR